MSETLSLTASDLIALQNHEILEQVTRQRKRLFEFIRKRVPDTEDAEDILQDVLFQFIESARAMKPIEQITSWLFTVARNKIIDLYRKKKPDSINKIKTNRQDDDEYLNVADLLFDPTDNPETKYLSTLIWKELDASLKLLPAEQSKVFIMHELEGLSFKQIAKITGDPVNTLLSRKRYAVIFLRSRLKKLYEDTFQ